MQMWMHVVLEWHGILYQDPDLNVAYVYLFSVDVGCRGITPSILVDECMPKDTGGQAGRRQGAQHPWGDH